jgi:protein STE50
MELRRITEEYRRLREDLLPVFRLAKEGQPLPYHPSGTNGQTYNQTSYNYDTSNTISPPAPTPSSTQSQSSGSGLSRKFSTKKLFLGSTPKNSSPTLLQQSAQDRPTMEQALDPAAAAERAVLSSSHLAAMNGGSQSTGSPSHSPNIPSPTSPPNTFSGSTLASRSYRSDLTTPSGRSTFGQNENDSYSSYSTRDSMKPAPTSRRAPTPAALDTPSGNSNASVEIFKSFRVSMEDPCYKVLPAALKKYNINAPWEHYALYIVYGDQERCLELNEKPLILFKQLDKEGKKPMFMLRKTNAHPEAAGGAELPSSAGLDNGSQFRGNGGRGQGAAYNPPGGII